MEGEQTNPGVDQVIHSEPQVALNFTEAYQQLSVAIDSGDMKSLFQALNRPEIVVSINDPEHGQKWRAELVDYTLAAFVTEKSKQEAKQIFIADMSDEDRLNAAMTNPTALAILRSNPERREQFLSLLQQPARAELAEREQRAEKAVMDLHVAEDRIGELVRQNTELEQTKESQNKALSSVIARLKEDNKQLNEANSRSALEQAEAHKALVNQKDHFEQKARELPILEDQNRGLRQQLEAERARVTDQEALSKELVEEKRLREVAEAHNAVLESKLSDASHIQNGLEAQRSGLQSSLQQSSSENDTLRAQRDHLAEELKKLEKEHATLQTQNEGIATGAEKTVQSTVRHIPIMTESALTPDERSTSANAQETALVDNPVADVGDVETQQPDLHDTQPIPEEAHHSEKRPLYFETPRAGDYIRYWKNERGVDPTSDQIPTGTITHELGFARGEGFEDSAGAIQYVAVQYPDRSDWTMLSRQYSQGKPIDGYWDGGKVNHLNKESLEAWQDWMGEMVAHDYGSGSEAFDAVSEEKAQEIRQHEQSVRDQFTDVYPETVKTWHGVLPPNISDRAVGAMSRVEVVRDWPEVRSRAYHALSRAEYLVSQLHAIFVSKAGEGSTPRSKFIDLGQQESLGKWDGTPGTLRVYDDSKEQIEVLLLKQVHEPTRLLRNLVVGMKPPKIDVALENLQHTNEAEARNDIAFAADEILYIDKWEKSIRGATERVNAEIAKLQGALTTIHEHREWTHNRQEKQAWGDYFERLVGVIEQSGLNVIDPQPGEQFDEQRHIAKSRAATAPKDTIVSVRTVGLVIPNDMESDKPSVVKAEVIVGDKE